ncbi:MAG TPA: kelch repeat-containing protein [Planctomycetota bacterium]|nr:kelch repeat-containing protein [Planctomycetota bacterium]
MTFVAFAKSLLVPGFACLVPMALAAQNPFHGNGIPSAYVENTPARVGGTLTLAFGSPTTPFPAAFLGVSDGVGPVLIPGLGNIGLDLLSPNYFAIGFTTNASGHVSTTIPIGPGINATTPPLFLHAATLEAGGLSISKTIRLEFANPNGWETVAPLGTARQVHTATPLGTGPRDNVTEVLICGGATQSFVVPLPIATAELFSPLTRSTTPLPNLSMPRAAHAAVRLNDGRVLVAGGTTTGGFVTATCEFFDPTTLTFSPAPSMSAPRAGHAMTLLDDGRVLVTGGVADWQNAGVAFIAALNTAQNTAEVFDPATNAWTSLPVMASKRLGHRQTKLQDGRVLVVSGIRGGYGGANPWGGGQVPQYTTSCELFDPITNTFTATGALSHTVQILTLVQTFNGRAFHGQSLLPSGEVLVTGGFLAEIYNGGTNNDETIVVGFCDVWNPSTGLWSQRADLPAPAAFQGQIPYGNGALVSGGFSGALTNLSVTAQTVLHDGNAVTPLANIGVDGVSGLASARGAHTLTPLSDGTFLVYGGGVWPNTLGDGFVFTPQ